MKYNFIKQKEYNSITITIPPNLLKKLEEGKYNKSKLIDGLLDKYFKDNKK